VKEYMKENRMKNNPARKVSYVIGILSAIVVGLLIFMLAGESSGAVLLVAAIAFLIGVTITLSSTNAGGLDETDYILIVVLIFLLALAAGYGARLGAQLWDWPQADGAYEHGPRVERSQKSDRLRYRPHGYEPVYRRDGCRPRPYWARHDPGPEGWYNQTRC